MEVLGSPDPVKDLNFITDEEALKYLKSIPTIKRKATLAKVYPDLDKNSLDILQKLLAFNPNNRISMEKCLDHPFFDDVIEKGHKMPKSKPIKIHFEYDLEENLEEKNLRKYFLEEFTIANPK